MPDKPPKVILASRSPYRRELLGRLLPEPLCRPADVDESPRPGEAPAGLAARLARAKADTIAGEESAALIIGSDQVAALGEQVLGKPGEHQIAARQLAACSGRAVVFYTSVCVLRAASGFCEQHTDITTVHFRTLSAAEIDAYLRADEPWDCAGSFRAESRGVVLFEAIDNRDPTALIGLPLIWLAGSLRRAGLNIV